MTSYLLLAAVAWAVATRGGTSPRDLLVVLLLLVTATLTSRAWPHRDPARTGALIALLGWLLVTGLLRPDVTTESVRVPLLVVLVVLTVGVARRLDPDERERVLTGLIVLGCLHAAVALVELVLALSRAPAIPPRAASLLDSPNGLGMLLVATSVLTAREVTRSGGFLPAAALVLQGAAIFATGSRSALVVATSLLVVHAATRPGWRLRALAAAGVVAAAAVCVWRFATEPPEQRIHLWREALSRIADRPLLGEGPLTSAYVPSAPHARVTTHAHNELVQWGVEYGLIGLGLGLLAVVLALRTGQSPGRGDRWVLVAGAALLAGGLTDVTLRITAITLVAAALVTFALSSDGQGPGAGERDARGHSPARRRVPRRVGAAPATASHRPETRPTATPATMHACAPSTTPSRSRSTTPDPTARR